MERICRRTLETFEIVGTSIDISQFFDQKLFVRSFDELFEFQRIRRGMEHFFKTIHHFQIQNSIPGIIIAKLFFYPIEGGNELVSIQIRGIDRKEFFSIFEDFDPRQCRRMFDLEPTILIGRILFRKQKLSHFIVATDLRTDDRRIDNISADRRFIVVV